MKENYPIESLSNNIITLGKHLYKEFVCFNCNYLLEQQSFTLWSNKIPYILKKNVSLFFPGHEILENLSL